MKTIVVYYSYTGNTRAAAKEEAEKQNAALCEIFDKERKPGKFKAYSAGCFSALRMKGWPIRPPEINLDEYDKIIVMSPVWAGHPAPAVNSLLRMLPRGKSVEMVMVSMSGESAAGEKVSAVIRDMGCEPAGYRDIKAGK